MYPGAKRVKRKLADRDTHPANTEVAQPENPFPISDYNHGDVPGGRVVEHRKNILTMRIRNVEAPGPPKYVTVLATTLTHGWGVDDGHHLGDVLLQKPVEKRLVAVLQRRQKDIALQIIFFEQKIFVGASQLFGDS